MMCSGYVLPGRGTGVDPGHAGGIMYLDWPGNALVFPFSFAQSAAMDGWIDGGKPSIV